MKGAARVLEELRSVYKERADIEAEYARRMQKLARQPLGRDETGVMRNALDTVRNEMEQMSRSHADLGQVFKRDLEGTLTEFAARTQQQRKGPLASIEKLYKQKTTQESYVQKSREKYEQDCIKINGYTAQSSLVQGRDLEKVTTKLDKAQSTVSSNEKDYQNFVRALKDTTLRWNSEWKAYLDQCQDLEEERLDFLKSNLWTYANSISTVCVADDQSCERVRVALETCEAHHDIVDFIRHAGTGNAIPDAPEYINYSRGQPPPARPTFRAAGFHRTTTRQPTFVQPAGVPESASTAEVPQRRSGGAPSSAPGPGAAPVAESGSQLPTADISLPPQEPMQYDQAQSSAQDPRLSARAPPGVGAIPLPGTTSAHSGGAGPDESTLASTPSKDAPSDKRISAKNFLARTPSKSYQNSPQPGDKGSYQPSSMASAPSTSAAVAASNTASTMTSSSEADDPIAKALADLRMKPSKSPVPRGQQGPPPPPSKETAPYRRQSAAPAPVVSDETRRPRSPSAAFMQEPERAVSPHPVEEVVGQYGQSFPGERRSVSLSRQNSNASRHSQYGVNQQQHERVKSPGPTASDSASTAGFAGVGARGRSPSPQPFQQQGSHPSQPKTQRAQQAPQQGGRPGAKPTASTSAMSVPQRSTTPLGISLDASGSVTHDQMAEDYIRRSTSTQPNQGRPASIVMQPNHSTGPHFAQQPPQPQSPFRQTAQPPSWSAQPPQPSQYGAAPHLAQSSQYATAPHHQQPVTPQSHYGPGSTAPPVPQQQLQQSQQMYGHPSNAQQAHTQAQQQPPRGHDSLGHQSAYGGYPSPYNQRPATAMAPSAVPEVNPSGGYGTPGSRYNTAQGPAPSYGAPQPQQQQQQQPPPIPQPETPASAYMHQYQQQQARTYPQAQASPGPRTTHTPVPAQTQPQQHTPYQQQQQMYGQTAGAPASQSQWTQHPLHSGAGAHGYPNGVASQQPQQTAQSAVYPQQHVPQARAASTAPAPAPVAAPPTGQFSDAGKPILFYVKALYDYSAQLEEEFSFTAGDVIAVWETSPDGWWQGELLDDARRRPGANTFPSNFVSLLN